MRFVIVVHGGAGLHGEDETPVKSALKRRVVVTPTPGVFRIKHVSVELATKPQNS